MRGIRCKQQLHFYWFAEVAAMLRARMCISLGQGSVKEVGFDEGWLWAFVTSRPNRAALLAG